MPEEVLVAGEQSPFLERKCIFCEQTFALGDEIVVCPRCRQPHHLSCWRDKGGCARRGCPQLASEPAKEKAGDGPPPPPSPYAIAGVIGGVIILVLALFFWPQPPDPALGRTKVTFLAEASINEERILTETVSQFNANHSEIYIDLQLVPFAGMEQKLIVQIAAQEAPDLFTIPYERLDFYVEQGMLLKLGDDGDPIYAVQHPAQPRMIGIFANTPHPQAAREVLDYLLKHIPPADLEGLKEGAGNENSIVY